MLRNFLLVVLFLLSLTGINAQTSQKKAFLGGYWTTKPDTNLKIKRRLCYLSFDIGDMFVDYNGMGAYPWYNNGNGWNNQRERQVDELYIGNADCIVLGIPFCIEGLNISTTDYTEGSVSYHSQLDNFLYSAGLMAGHNFFKKSHSMWLKSIMFSAGALYQHGEFNLQLTNSNTSEAVYNNYYFDNIVGRAEMMFEFPGGLYCIPKQDSTYMTQFRFMIKLGYDVSFVPAHWENPEMFNNDAPNIYTGGFYVSIGMSIYSYHNKELHKK